MSTLKPERIFHDDLHFILIVKEDGATRERISSALKSSGYRVIEACDGKQGLALFRKYSNEVHLVMTDILMSEMNGVDFVSCIHQISPRTKVIFLSGQQGYVGKILGEISVYPHDRRSTTRSAYAEKFSRIDRRSPFTLLLRKVEHVLYGRGKISNFLYRIMSPIQYRRDANRLKLKETEHARISGLWRSALISEGIPEERLVERKRERSSTMVERP
jgi:hypothetical protein